MNMINENMSAAEVVKSCPKARHIFDRDGLKGCGGEHGPSESLSSFATVHQVNVDELIREINCDINNPSAKPYIYTETLPDFIYQRFFKAGVLTVLTVGCLWGAVNLLQTALGKNFLQLRLLPSIHGHAHAMIFGWEGMFVMGFAHQQAAPVETVRLRLWRRRPDCYYTVPCLRTQLGHVGAYSILTRGPYSEMITTSLFMT